jgi:hypothetical protein
MKIYYIITDAQRVLEEKYFIPTLTKHTKDFTLHPIYYKPKNENIGNFGDEDYMDILTFRSQKFIEVIEENLGETIIFSDVDIVILKNFYSILLQLIAANDILHTAERLNLREINGGFTVIRCSEKTKRFYEIILEKTLKKGCLEYLDQHAITEYYMVDKNPLGLRWRMLPPQLFCIRYDWTHLQKYKKFIMLFHATNTIPENGESSLALKEKYLTGCLDWQLDKIKRFY